MASCFSGRATSASSSSTLFWRELWRVGLRPRRFDVRPRRQPSRGAFRHAAREELYRPSRRRIRPTLPDSEHRVGLFQDPELVLRSELPASRLGYDRGGPTLLDRSLRFGFWMVSRVLGSLDVGRLAGGAQSNHLHRRADRDPMPLGPVIRYGGWKYGGRYPRYMSGNPRRARRESVNTCSPDGD